jgi:hypothetical protein
MMVSNYALFFSRYISFFSRRALPRTAAAAKAVEM